MNFKLEQKVFIELFYDWIPPPIQECPKSPDGKHHKGKTPLIGKDNQWHIICKYCGKDLD